MSNNMNEIQYYKTYKIKFKVKTYFGDIVINNELAWPSCNDNGEIIWTLCIDNSTIISNEYVINYKLL